MILFSRAEHLFTFIRNCVHVKFVRITRLKLNLNMFFGFYKEFFP